MMGPRRNRHRNEKVPYLRKDQDRNSTSQNLRGKISARWSVKETKDLPSTRAGLEKKTGGPGPGHTLASSLEPGDVAWEVNKQPHPRPDPSGGKLQTALSMQPRAYGPPGETELTANNSRAHKEATKRKAQGVYPRGTLVPRDLEMTE